MDDGAYLPRYHWDSNVRGEGCFVIIQYTHSGRGAFRWEGRVWDVPPGHAFICVVPERSAYYFPDDASEPWKFAWLNFYGELANSLCRALRNAYGPVLALPPRSVAAAKFFELTANAEKRLSLDPCDVTLAAFSFLMEWKRLLDHPQTRGIDPVEMVMGICKARFREPLCIKELAAQTGITREHLTRIFTERTGISPARHLRQLRVAAAREMLASPGTPLKEVALRCGFPSVKAMQLALKSVRMAQ